MIIQNDVDLSKKCTFHIGGIAKNYYIPENEEDVTKVLNLTKNEELYIISAGSNLLINDKKTFNHVMYLGELDKTINQISEAKFYIGCSNRIQAIINYINELGYGGIEELYSIPALFGGIVYMNAGIGFGKDQLFSISEFIIRVKVLNKNNNKIEWIENDKCNFKHRHSIFHNNEYIILGAECEFYKQDIEKSKSRIKARIERSNKYQEKGKGTFGTAFSNCNGKLLKLASIFGNKKGGIRFGNKNKNWFVNEGNGTFNDAMFLINRCKIIHKIFLKKLECEVRIWE